MKFSDKLPWKNQSREVSTVTPQTDPFMLFRNRMDEMMRDFDSLQRGFWPSFKGFDTSLNPASIRMDIVESETNFALTAELPGMEAKDVEVKVEGNTLIIRGEKKQEYEESEKENAWHRREITYGSFYRAIQLPAEADDSNINADFKNGLLKIVVPKVASHIENVKKIPIKG